MMVVSGSVDGTDCRLIMYSGASISPFPKEKVEVRDGKPTILRYGKNNKALNTSVVTVTVGDSSWKKQVALILENEATGEWLLSIDLWDNDDCK